MHKLKVKKIIVFSSLLPIVILPTITAVSCAKTSVPEELIKDRSTPIKINPPYSTQENTASEILEDGKLDKNHKSKVFSIDDNKYNDVKYKFLELKTETLNDGIQLVVLKVEAKFDDFEIPHIYTHYYRFLSEKQKETKVKKNENENAIKSLIYEEEKNGLNFFKITIHENYKNSSLEEIKIAGDEAININYKNSNFVKLPQHNGIEFEVIDLIITQHNDYKIQPKLIAKIKITKGDNEEQAQFIHSIIINYQGE